MNYDTTKLRLKYDAVQMAFAGDASIFMSTFEEEITAAMDNYDARYNTTLGRDTLKRAMETLDRMKQASGEFLASFDAEKALENTQIESKVQ